MGFEPTSPEGHRLSRLTLIYMIRALLCSFEDHSAIPANNNLYTSLKIITIIHMNGKKNTLIVVHDKNFQEILSNNRIIVADFWAKWCSPCRAMNLLIEDLSNIYAEQVLFIKLNVDENSITPSKYGISSIPTFLIIKDSQVMESIIGAVDQEMFENKINKYL